MDVNLVLHLVRHYSGRKCGVLDGLKQLFWWICDVTWTYVLVLDLVRRYSGRSVDVNLEWKLASCHSCDVTFWNEILTSCQVRRDADVTFWNEILASCQCGDVVATQIQSYWRSGDLDWFYLVSNSIQSGRGLWHGVMNLKLVVEKSQQIPCCCLRFGLLWLVRFGLCVLNVFEWALLSTNRMTLCMIAT